MTVTYVLHMTITQTWQKVVDTGLRKDKDNFNEYLLTSYLSKSEGTVYDSTVRPVVSVALDEKHSHLRCLQECKKTRTLYAAKKV